MKKQESKKQKHFNEFIEGIRNFIKENQEDKLDLCRELYDFVNWVTELDEKEKIEFIDYATKQWYSYVTDMRNRRYKHVTSTKRVWTGYVLQSQAKTKAYELYKKDMENATEIVDYETFLSSEYQVKWYIESLLVDEELIKAYHKTLKWQTQLADEVITRKVNAVEGMFRIMFRTEEERAKRNAVLEEVMYQVEVCEGFLKSIPEETVKEWLQYRSAIQVQQKAHDYKMSRLSA